MCVQKNTMLHTTTRCYTLQHTATHILTKETCQFGNICVHKKTTTTHYNTPQHTTTHSNTLQYTATHILTKETCQFAEHVFIFFCSMQHKTPPATHCKALQHTATHCNTLQHTATHCDTHTYKRGVPICSTCVCKKKKRPVKET